MPELIEFVHGHLFCGLGGGAKGFNGAESRLGSRVARFRCAGGIDVDPGAVTAFSAATGVQGTVLDLFSREQYVSFHGHEPPQDWSEATPADVRKAMGNQHLHVLFTSPPCKGYSGLLSQQRSESARYQALNALALRGVMLALEAYRDDPIEFVLLENVPRIQSRGGHFLDQIIQLLHSYGYATAETTHDCGELGGLAQSRRRFLLVARHMEKVPPFLYEPQKKPLIAVGRLLEKFAMPGDMAAGPMHRIPALQWKTWVRLAFVEAGSDWRSLQKLRVENGMLTDYGLLPEQAWNDGYGVRRWEDEARTVTGDARPSKGAFSVADPRVDGHHKSVQLGVQHWHESAATVTCQMMPGQGPFSIADPRIARVAHNNVFRVVRWGDTSPAVTAGGHPTAGGLNVADPRPGWNRHGNNLVVETWDQPSRTVIAGGKGVQGGQLSIADPRPGLDRGPGDHYLTAGHYGVVPWDRPALAVTGSARHDNGHHNVADPRLPASSDRLACLIRSLDGTWHRPFTTLELAALQGLVEPDECSSLPGSSDSRHREWIGNAVPPPAARAIAGAMGHALLLALSGETFVLNAMPVWVRPVSVAIAMARTVA